MHYIKNTFLLAAILLVFTACQKDPLAELTRTDRQFLSFTVDNQVGPALIKADDEGRGTIEIFALTAELNLASVTPRFEISEKASVSPAAGQSVDFSGDDRTVVYTVTSESGATREWTVFLRTYDSPLDGSWDVAALTYDWHIGLFQDWGWGVFGEYDVSTSSYDPANYAQTVFSADFPSAAKEEDNVLTLATTLINQNGNPEGTFTFTAGADGEFASFVFDGHHLGGSKDYSGRFRRLFDGAGVWEFNESGSILTLWEGNRSGRSSSAEVNFNDEGQMVLDFNTWVDEFTWDHWDAESHIQNALNVYYKFDAQ